MPPAPASIAAEPSPRRRAPWNPAVPPPPVAGAAVGNGLADRLRVTDGDADGLADRLGDDVADGLGVGLAEMLALGVATPGVPLAEAAAVADALVVDEDVGSAAEDEDVVQAETAAEASMVAMPQPTA